MRPSVAPLPMPRDGDGTSRALCLPSLPQPLEAEAHPQMPSVCGDRRIGVRSSRSPKIAPISRSIRLDAILLDILACILLELEPSCHLAATRPRFACLRLPVL